MQYFGSSSFTERENSINPLSSATMSFSFMRSKAWKNWYAPEAIPIYVLVLGACTGASWYIYRLATGPQVTWTKNNPHPYLSIEQDQGAPPPHSFTEFSSTT
ncbi:hypothetical protein C8R46DRAFT_642131 [Mycena filopes]|nr:hypothetical protein C8R46DRAFT_642131 [Mycena filopes]